MVEKDTDSAPVSFQNDYKQSLIKIAELEAKLETQKSSNHSLQSQLSKLRKNQGVSSEPTTEEGTKESPEPRYLELEKKIDKLSTEMNQKLTTTVQNSPPVVSSTGNSSTTLGNSNNSAPVSVTDSHVHNFKYFQPFCTGNKCGTNSKNPEFKPEMRCKNCKNTVGSFESVKQRVLTGDQPNCPFCGLDLVAQPITDEAKRKVQEYMASSTKKVEVAA